MFKVTPPFKVALVYGIPIAVTQSNDLESGLEEL